MIQPEEPADFFPVLLPEPLFGAGEEVSAAGSAASLFL